MSPRCGWLAARPDGDCCGAYVHVRAANATPGKQEKAEQAALTAARGTEWEALLEPPIRLAEADVDPSAAGAPEAAIAAAPVQPAGTAKRTGMGEEPLRD